jgi:hypothetical protein
MTTPVNAECRYLACRGIIYYSYNCLYFVVAEAGYKCYWSPVNKLILLMCAISDTNGHKLLGVEEYVVTNFQH